MPERERLRREMGDAWFAYVRSGFGSKDFEPPVGIPSDQVIVPDLPTVEPITIEVDGGQPPHGINIATGSKDEPEGRFITFINDDGSKRTIRIID